MHTEMQRVLPASPDIERLILGAITTAPDTFPAVSDLLSQDDFSDDKHALIFSAMHRLHEAGDSLDVRSLYESLKPSPEGFQWLGYLVSLSEGLPAVYGLENYCRIVSDKAVLRRAILWADSFADRCEHESDSSALIADAERLTELVTATRRRTLPLRTFAEVIEAEGGYNEFLNPQRTPGIDIPFATINQTLSGLRRAKLILLAARPSVGKSAFAWQCAEHAAEQGHRVLFISLEMSDRDTYYRAIAGKAQVSAYRFRRGELSATERSYVHEACTQFVDLGGNLLTCDSPDTTPQAINATLRSLAARNEKPALVCLDYIQILKTVGRHDNRTQEVASISRALLSMARTFDIPVIALSQLNRDMEKMAREPQLSDLKETSQLEQDAHQIIFLWAKDDVQSDDSPIRQVKWKVAKNRDGVLNRGTLAFHRSRVRFYEEEMNQSEEYAA